MNQPYAPVNQPYATLTLTLALALCVVFGVQFYKNNARMLLSCILSILNSDWLQHGRSVCAVYECLIISWVGRCADCRVFCKLSTACISGTNKPVFTGFAAKYGIKMPKTTI